MPRPHLDLADFLPYLVNRIGARFVLHFTEHALVRRDLTIGTWRVLAALSEHGVQRQTDLAALTSIDASTLSRLVSRLVRSGLVTRRRSDKSSREVLIAPTAKAQALLRRLVPMAVALQRDATKGLSARELEITRKVLRKMHDNLDGA